MDLNGKIQTLIQFINEGLRRKIYYINYFEFILETFNKLIENQIFEQESFKNFIKTTKIPIYNEILNNNDFREQFDEFLSKNPEINKLIETEGIHYSIIITNLRFQFEFLDKFENPEISIEKFEVSINKDIKNLIAELHELNRFRKVILKNIEKIELCCVCDRKTLKKCIKCKKCVCEEHAIFDFCPNCAKKILDEKSKKT